MGMVIEIPVSALKVGDVVPGWGTVTEIEDRGEVIDFKTDTCGPNEWAMSCDRAEKISVERDPFLPAMVHYDRRY